MHLYISTESCNMDYMLSSRRVRVGRRAHAIGIAMQEVDETCATPDPCLAFEPSYRYTFGICNDALMQFSCPKSISQRLGRLRVPAISLSCAIQRVLSTPASANNVTDAMNIYPHL